MPIRWLIVLGLCAASHCPSARAEQVRLLDLIANRRFVTPDAYGQSADVMIQRRDHDAYVIIVAGQVIEEYRIAADGTGRAFNPAAPDVVSAAQSSSEGWSRSYGGVTTRFSLTSDGDILAVRSGAVEHWMAGHYIYAFSPVHADLSTRLKARLGQIHAEAEAYEDHGHGSMPEEEMH